MKKSLIATAVAAGLLTAGAASADPTVYGILHLSLDSYSDDHISGGNVVKSSDLNMVSHTSAIGIKGSEDLGDGLKAIYKVEFQIAPDERATNITDRDQWIGLQGGWGSVKFGTMSSNYKQMGGKVDPLYRTEAEGRGILNMHSPRLHGGAGIDRGRMTNGVQYASPKMGGVQLVVNTTFSGAGANNSNNDETVGLGIRYDNKTIMAYFDYIEPGNQGGNARGSESAMKVGGKFSADAFSVALQYEMVEDFNCRNVAVGTTCKQGDYIFAAGTFSIDKNNVIALTLGQQADVSQSFAVAYVHNLSKQTNVYAGYGSVEADSCTGSGAAKTCSYGALGTDTNGVAHDTGSVFTFGMRKSF